jgi:hypothetical protein
MKAIKIFTILFFTLTTSNFFAQTSEDSEIKSYKDFLESFLEEHTGPGTTEANYVPNSINNITILKRSNNNKPTKVRAYFKTCYKPCPESKQTDRWLEILFDEDFPYCIYYKGNELFFVYPFIPTKNYTKSDIQKMDELQAKYRSTLKDKINEQSEKNYQKVANYIIEQYKGYEIENHLENIKYSFPHNVRREYQKKELDENNIPYYTTKVYYDTEYGPEEPAWKNNSNHTVIIWGIQKYRITTGCFFYENASISVKSGEIIRSFKIDNIYDYKTAPLNSTLFFRKFKYDKFTDVSNSTSKKNTDIAETKIIEKAKEDKKVFEIAEEDKKRKEKTELDGVINGYLKANYERKKKEEEDNEKLKFLNIEKHKKIDSLMNTLGGTFPKTLRGNLYNYKGKLKEYKYFILRLTNDLNNKYELIGEFNEDKDVKKDATVNGKWFLTGGKEIEKSNGKYIVFNGFVLTETRDYNYMLYRTKEQKLEFSIEFEIIENNLKGKVYSRSGSTNWIFELVLPK